MKGCFEEEAKSNLEMAYYKRYKEKNQLTPKWTALHKNYLTHKQVEGQSFQTL